MAPLLSSESSMGYIEEALGKKKGRESINSQWNKTNGTWPRINPTNGEPNKHGMSEDTHGVG